MDNLLAMVQAGVVDLQAANPVSDFILFMRAMTVAVWGVALQRIWVARKSPVANLVMVAALAIMASVLTLIFHHSFSPETLAFFLASGQVAMAIAVIRMFRWLSHHKVALAIEAATTEAALNGGLRGEFGKRPVYSCLMALSAILAMGVIYLIFVYIDGAGL